MHAEIARQSVARAVVVRQPHVVLQRLLHDAQGGVELCRQIAMGGARQQIGHLNAFGKRFS
jgi:hypothetical protein